MNRVCERCHYQLVGDDQHPTVEACLQILTKEQARLYDWIGKLSRRVGELDSRTHGSIRFGAIAPSKPSKNQDKANALGRGD